MRTKARESRLTGFLFWDYGSRTMDHGSRAMDHGSRAFRLGMSGRKRQMNGFLGVIEVYA